MLLAVDIGNTQTVLGLFEGEHLRHTWRLASDTARTSDELKAIVTQLFHEAGKEQALSLTIEQVVIASVVPALTQVWMSLVKNLSYAKTDIAPLIIDANIATANCAPLGNPAEVGADRIANAVAARMLYAAPAIVLDFGTATNIDVIDSDGNYCGGIISPGVQTSATALFASAARLPTLDLEVPKKVLGTSTKTAVQSGLLYGEAAKVSTLIKALQDEDVQLAAAGVPIIATGGLAPLITPLIAAVTHSDEHLTLKGLQLIAAEAANKDREESVHV